MYVYVYSCAFSYIVIVHTPPYSLWTGFRYTDIEPMDIKKVAYRHFSNMQKIYLTIRQLTNRQYNIICPAY